MIFLNAVVIVLIDEKDAALIIVLTFSSVRNIPVKHFVGSSCIVMQLKSAVRTVVQTAKSVSSC